MTTPEIIIREHFNRAKALEAVLQAKKDNHARIFVINSQHRALVTIAELQHLLENDTVSESDLLKWMGYKSAENKYFVK